MCNSSLHTSSHPLVIGQRIFANYRIPIWEEIADRIEREVFVLAGDNLPSHSEKADTEASSSNLKLKPFEAVNLFTSGNQRVVWFKGYSRAVKKLEPFALTTADDLTALPFLWSP